MWAEWWVWIVAALLLGIVELLAPAFIVLGFAIGALIIGLLLLVGGPVAAMIAGSLPLLLVMFAALSLAAWILLRRLVGVRHGQSRVIDRDINSD
ncbi:NfeD family protein [Pseudooceanicola onchidii]|uniref:NfeD family protein n=1 Tax=Pseudooceanicola onchidii TaxID=2562279 RepID=UPI0010AB3D4A|nr:hypothetical protein [Pseudooceanicola onchidii]